MKYCLVLLESYGRFLSTNMPRIAIAIMIAIPTPMIVDALSGIVCIGCSVDGAEPTDKPVCPDEV